MFDNSLEELLKDDTPRTNEEFQEHLKFHDDDYDINEIKMYRQKLINTDKL